MKKTDLAMVILIATVCVFAAFFVTRAVMGDPTSERTAKTIEKIDAEIVPPDPAIFNRDAINPAVKVQINDSTQQ